MSKGGSTTSEVKIPEYLEKAAQRNLNKAEAISQLGYVPYYGPDVAAFQPMQNAAFQNTAGMAGAFGMAAPQGQDVYGTMGAPTQYANGVLGYSSAPMYGQSVAELGRLSPGQKSYLDSFFVDPRTGKAGVNIQAPIDYNAYDTQAASERKARVAPSGGLSANDPLSQAPASNQPSGGYNTNTGSLGSAVLSYAPGGVNDPFLTSKLSQAVARKTSKPSATDPGSSAPKASPRPVARPTASSSSSSSGKGCVVATHAVASGAFTPSMKREAVVWCMDVLHGKWWGEAIRRGYRHMGRKKIEQGKAHEHYAEFRRYIAFANGKERTLRGALTFTLRTAQFFVVGMFDKEA